jgi:hypothetical protein
LLVNCQFLGVDSQEDQCYSLSNGLVEAGKLLRPKILEARYSTTARKALTVRFLAGGSLGPTLKTDRHVRSHKLFFEKQASLSGLA